MNTSYLKLKDHLNKFLINLSKKIPYIKILRDKIQAVQALKRREYREINFKILKHNFRAMPVVDEDSISENISQIDEGNVIAYVIDITKTRSNIYLNIVNSTGRLMLTVSVGNLINLSATKRKSARFLVIKKIFKLITKQKYLKGKPLALHLKNKRIPLQFIRKLRKKNIVKSISFFYKKPFNGCRHRKVRSV